MLKKLDQLRSYGGKPRTIGLSDDQLRRFNDDATLAAAIDDAVAQHTRLQATHGELLALDEERLIKLVQAEFLNFYDAATVNPYVALAARGPWLITTHGAVLHDTGGYGMLGLGHAPQPVLDTMAAPWAMANVMTPSFSQLRFTDALRAEVGHTRGGCPFDKFLAMNSGSEAVTVAARISDVNAKQKADGREVRFLALKGAFHGRTDRPAQASDSSLPTYRKFLKSFADRDNLITVPPNDVAALEQAFARANEDNIFIEMMLIEPVMGEGNPGMAMSRSFYDAARRLTTEHGSLLLIDSIQAGLRATGTLSVVDYPGFEDAEAPDLETYSKALNAGQFPLSILAMSTKAKDVFQRGIYGNTMTTNPRALEVAITVLEAVTPELRTNIRTRGAELVDKLTELRAEFPALIKTIQGTGLLVSAEIDSSIPVVGFGGLEEQCRTHGLGVIHGGVNALRFTPHFELSSKEIELIVEIVRSALLAFQIERQAAHVSTEVPVTA